MIVKKLELRNFQVIKDFSADFEGNVYLITGDNELGKSTILKAIGALLTGDRDAVLRNGEDKGFAKMIVGNDGEEYEVKLSFTKANPRGSLMITSRTTGKKTDNKSALQALFGYTDFDAVEFSRWSETAEGRRKQIRLVKSLLPEQARDRIDAIDKEVEEVKNERMYVNATIKHLQIETDNAREELAGVDVTKYTEKIDMAKLLEEQRTNAQLIEKAKLVRGKRAERQKELSAIPDNIAQVHSDYTTRMEQVKYKLQATEAQYKKDLEQLKAKYEELRKNITIEAEAIENTKNDDLNYWDEKKADCETRINNADKWLAEYELNNPENIDIAWRVAEAEEHNKVVTLVKYHKAKADALADAKAKAEEHETHLTQLADERKQLVESSNLPVEGLSFSEDGLTLHDVPFVAGKVSDSQIMEVATKLIIASNPNVKVFRIARGESLGAKRLQSIVELAKANGYQGFIENVQRGQEELKIEEYTETN